MDNEITLHWAAEFAQSVLAELMDHTDMAPSMRTQAAHAVDHLETALDAVQSEEAQALKSYANDCAKNPALCTIDAAFSYAWRAAIATKQAEAATASNERLLPCPFCGNAKNLAMVNEKHDHSGGYFIACPVCDASTGLRYAMGDDPLPLLTEQWNRRAALATQQEAQPQAVARWNWNTSSLEWLVPYRSEFHLKPLFFADRAAQQATGERG